MARVTFYIDGFNFYYGIKRAASIENKWNNAYWIDIVKLCKGFLAPNDILEKVIYFTATPLSKTKSQRQSAFLNANKAINEDKLEIIRGKYLEKHILCPYCNGDIYRPEEKKTDVNISIRMINDCIHNNTDTIILISADTDLIPPMELIKKEFPNIKLKVYFPPTNYSHDIVDFLRKSKTKPVLLKNNYKRFENAVMPDSILDGKYTIPVEWKNRQTESVRRK